MEETRDIYIFEEDGFFWLTDRYDLNRMRFIAEGQRTKWVEKFKAATGKEPHIIHGKP